MPNINGFKVGHALRKTKKWVPKKWKAKYTQMVFMSAQGASLEAIAEAFRMGPHQVSNILNLPEAERIKVDICNNLENELKGDINRTLEAIGRKSMERIKDVIYNDKLSEHNPLAIFDRSKAMLQATGVLKSADTPTGGVHNTNIMVGNDIAKILGEAIVKSQRIRDSNEIVQSPPTLSK
jgi:hypothetical protein